MDDEDYGPLPKTVKGSSESLGPQVMVYASLPNPPLMRDRIAKRLCVWAFLGIAPALVVVMVDIFINPVDHHWLSGVMFDEYFILTAIFCSVAGMICGVISGFLGNVWGFIASLILLATLLFLPVLEYA
jgi:hypothetical protein